MKNLIDSSKKPKEIKGVFLHGIDLGYWLPCLNIPLSGGVASSDYAAYIDPGLRTVHKSIRDIEIHQLKIEPSSIKGVLNPRVMSFIIPAAIIRKGDHVEIGHHNTKRLREDEIARILRISDIELAFEDVRRKILPQAASRLCSLFLAENTENGRNQIKTMFPLANLCIIEVTIPQAFRFNKVDVTWFDNYCEEPKAKYIENYWKSVPYDKDVPTWEYLVEGFIKIKDPRDLEYIRKYGAKP